MRKLGILAIALVVGTTLAFGSSIGIPWFVDNAPAANKLPGVKNGYATFIYLKNMTGTSKTLHAAYYAEDGTPVALAGATTASIAANSTMAFRPVANDPLTVTGGQEGSQGVLFPNRPWDGTNNRNAQNDFTGSLTVSWVGEAGDIVGGLTTVARTARTDGDFVTSYGWTLPQGQ